MSSCMCSCLAAHNHFKIPNIYSAIINHCTEIVAVLLCMTAITSMRRVGGLKALWGLQWVIWEGTTVTKQNMLTQQAECVSLQPWPNRKPLSLHSVPIKCSPLWPGRNSCNDSTESVKTKLEPGPLCAPKHTRSHAARPLEKAKREQTAKVR